MHTWGRIGRIGSLKPIVISSLSDSQDELSESDQWNKPASLTRAADPLVPNRVSQDLKTCERVMGKRGVEPRACKSSSRRRFREFEDAPFAVYGSA